MSDDWTDPVADPISGAELLATLSVAITPEEAEEGLERYYRERGLPWPM